MTVKLLLDVERCPGPAPGLRVLHPRLKLTHHQGGLLMTIDNRIGALWKRIPAPSRAAFFSCFLTG